MAALAICLVSCGDGSVIVHPTSKKISGPWGKYFEVVDRDYKIINNELSVEFKRIAEGSLKGEINYINVDLLDENGNVIASLEQDDVDNLLAIDVDETAYVKYNVKFSNTKGAVKIKISSKSESLSIAVDEDNVPSEDVSETEDKTIDVILPSALKGSVEVVKDAYHVKENSYGFPEITITFKLLKTVNTESLVSEYNQMWIVGEGQDEKGRVIKELMPNYNEWRTDDSEGREFKAFLEDEPGNTISMTFTGSKEGTDSETMKKVEKFKLKLTK